MADSTVQSNNRRIEFVKNITMEWFSGNQFSPYMGTSTNAIIHRLLDLSTKGGSQINVPLLLQASGKGKGRGTLVGNEEKLQNYGCRLWVDRSRNAVTMSDSEAQEDNGALWDKARPVLSNWGIKKQEQDIIEALMSLPSESPPTGYQMDDGQTVNGILYEAASAIQLDDWLTANADRVFFGDSDANLVAGDFTASLANVDNTTGICTAQNLSRLKSKARRANPRLTPTRWNSSNNRPYFQVFMPTVPFADLKKDLQDAQLSGYARDPDMSPVFQGGDIIWDGMYIREFPEIDDYVEGAWGAGTTSGDDLLTAGAALGRVNPVYLCGESALGMPWAKMPSSTMKKEDDYGELPGRGITCMYGVGKMFYKPESTTDLIQWGVATGFFGNSDQ